MLSNQEVVDFVTTRIGQAMEPEDICEELMTRWGLGNPFTFNLNSGASHQTVKWVVLAVII